MMVWSQKQGQRDSARNVRTCDRMLISGWCRQVFIYLFIHTKDNLPCNTIDIDAFFLVLEEFPDSIKT